MKRETIEKAALEHAVNTTGLDYIGEVECENGFIAGARCRIDSVWHDTCEIPEPGKDCLVEYKDGDGNVCSRLDRRSEYISHNSTNVGTGEMIKLMMNFLEEITGIHGALQGQNASSGTSGKLYESQVNNAANNLIDLLESFKSFRVAPR